MMLDRRSRAYRQALKRENATRPRLLTPVPRDQWPHTETSRPRIAAWISRSYLVQAFEEDGGVVRLSVNRVTLGRDGRWDDQITWDELQEIKRQVGYGDSFAVEIFPRDRDVVNVANMRHLWVLPHPLDFGWRSVHERA